MLSPELFGILAGATLALGYVVYFIQSVRHEIEPNPTTWLMWAYGTSLLTVVEADLNASWALLVLPITCAVSSVGVAILCFRRGTLRWPRGWEQYAFFTDVILTCVYMSAWGMSLAGGINVSVLALTTVAILVASNLSTVVSFTPIIHSTYICGSNEKPLPWTIWTFAYGLLALSTVLSTQGVELLLMLIYPISCIVLHALVAFLSVRGTSLFQR